MSVRYDPYQLGDSWLHRLDPRAKPLFVICGTAVVLTIGNLWLMIVALAATHLALLSAGISRDRIAWVWRMTLPTMVMIAILWVILYRGQGTALVSFWFIEISLDNIAQALAMALRIATLAFLYFLWLFSTDQTTLVRGLVALGLPYPWGLTLAMALRYIPTMASTLRMISEAQQARALDLTQGGLIKRARAYVPITVAMVITALRTADNLGRALESRALGAVPRRTYWRQLHYGANDWLWTAAVIVVTGGLLWARYALGIGGLPLALGV